MAISQVTYIDSELELASLEAARFSWAGGDYRGRPSLGPDLAERLLALEDEHEAYGLALYDAVFPPGSEQREGLREAILAAEREKSRLRFRLHLVPDLPAWVHALYWELLADSDRRLALARSPDTAFSRYLDVRRVIGGLANERPRLLCVASAPSDCTRYGMAEIRRAEILRRLEASVAPLADAVEVAFLEPPITLARLRERLMESGGFQLLHFYGHGQNLNGGSSLVLEDEQGQAHFVGEELLAEVFLGVRELRLVTLVACYGGAPSSGDPFSGLAGRLVQRGLPAVIAMRRAVRIGSAHLFTQHFYRHLAQTGRADAAVNEARQQLYLARPQTIDWSSPVLYSRLADGRLWIPRAEPAKPVAQTKPRRRISLRRLRPLQWLTALLAPALFLLGLWPAARSELHLDLHATRIAVWLAQCVTAIESLNLVEPAPVLPDPVLLPSPFPISIPSTNARHSIPRKVGSRVTIYIPPPPESAPVAPDDQAEGTASLKIADPEQEEEPQATAKSDVRPTPLDTIETFRLSRAEMLVPVSQDVAEEEDDSLDPVEPESIFTDIRMDDYGSPGSPPGAGYGEKGLYKLGLIFAESDKRNGGEVLNAAIDAFVAAHRFTMVERKKLNNVFTEQDLQEFIGGKVNNKLSDVLGLDLLGIVDFTVDTKHVPGQGPETTWIIVVRLVDVKTSGIVTTITSERASLLPASTIREAGKLLFESIHEAFPPAGYVVQINGKEVIVDLGSDAGLKKGDPLEIVQEGEKVIHPVTGEVLAPPMKVIGELKVTSASAKISICKIKKVKGELRLGSLVRARRREP